MQLNLRFHGLEVDGLKLQRKILRKGVERLISRIGVDGLFREFGDDLPLRSELFNVDQLERHAAALSDWHQIAPASGLDRLLARLAENELTLLGAYEVATDALERNQRITPAGEWLIDNFYLIEEQIRTARRHLPKPYSRSLPRLANGPSAGYPRIYDLALELISHVDGRVNTETLKSFVNAYQLSSPLLLGELWAMPIMMRQALIENLRRVAARIAKGTLDRTRANYWADRFIQCAEETPDKLILAVADMARPEPVLTSAFVAEIARRLRGQSPTLAIVVTWIEQRLGEHGQSIEQMVQIESQQQAIDQVSIGNSIGSLRELEATDWTDFVESLSVVEQTLLKDPAQIYYYMDFGTRDQYRHVIEEVALRSSLTEHAVAELAIRLAMEHQETDGSDSKTAHVGYFLIGNGRPLLESAARMRPHFKSRIGRFALTIPLTLYLGALFVLTAAVTAGVLWQAGSTGWTEWVLGAALFLGTMHLSVGLVNWLVTLCVKPNRLPRMDFSKGIPQKFHSLVIVPSMLTSSQGVDELLEGLEVRFLANRDENLSFGLLTDFGDAPQEHQPEDQALLLQAQGGIESLNAMYGDDAGDRFFLFHRPRLWNPYEGVWMGRERKRGKLSDLNALLRGGSRSAFSLIVGETERLADVKYVITLDTDTLLPRETAWQLVATMAHPLNRAHIDPRLNIVTEGYGILQPGVATSLEPAGQSWFARLNSGESGIDPYTRTISNVYQDLFHEGAFIGKGIYDIDTFSATLEHRFLDNQILSHDLLEGCYARSGLASDIPVYESYPARYSSDVKRRHRWMRGDWQISSWILPVVKGADGHWQRNPLSLLSRWKIFDNLRRSLTSAALLTFLITGWLMSSSAWLCTAVVVGIIFVPALCISLVNTFRKASDVPWLLHLRGVAQSLSLSVAQSLLTLSFLPYETYVCLDAILRTWIRMLITHRHLLQWTTSSDAERTAKNSLASFLQTMWIAPATALVASALLFMFQQSSLVAAAPMLALWLVAPLIAWRISQPAIQHEVQLTRQQELFLHGMVRKTWRFFETFVGAEDHWLPPDNFQEVPVPVVAHRTSPTNIGVSLLSSLAAYDFGLISSGRFIERTSNTFTTLSQLERFRGHFLNWYDTQTLQPLIPRYVSSVDSGNLVGHLLTLRSGLLELPFHPLVSARLWDSFAQVREIFQDGINHGRLTTQMLKPSLFGIKTLMKYLPEKGSRIYVSESLSESRDQLRNLLLVLTELAIDPPREQELEELMLLHDLKSQVQDHLQDLTHIVPWLEHAVLPIHLWKHHLLKPEQRTRELKEFLITLDGMTTLQEIADAELHLSGLNALIEQTSSTEQDAASELSHWLIQLRTSICEGSRNAQSRLDLIDSLAQNCGEFAEVDYDFLYNPSRRLLTIGYNVSERRADTACYDLLASEARLASFIGISQGKLEQEHWFALGRLLTTSNGRPILLSWSGSMFEYLMPLLVMPNYSNTLLDQTYQAVVARQIEYGRQRGIPWGISESGYHLTDAHFNYQYRAFGVPGLGFKRGLVDDLVIAPYATAMALMVAPDKACANLQLMAEQGFSGIYGFYEAIDYTRSRVVREQPYAIVRSYMAHHQGMSFLSLAYLLLNKPMQRRFEADPQFQATELILQERIPKVIPFYPHSSEVAGARKSTADQETLLRIFKTAQTPSPEAHLLSNGRYHVMVTNSGGGYSSWKGLAITRWREDATRDQAGAFCYIRDMQNGEFWSTTYQPTCRPAKRYEAIFSQARAEFRRRDGDIRIHTEIAVSPEDDIEIRRTTITNRSRTPRTIELTSYAEVVLASPAADAAHPAFSNLFVQTEILKARQAILCTRRPRSEHEHPPWMLHLMAVVGAQTGETSYETDRLKFVGRSRTVTAPAAMSSTAPLSNSSGSVLDPIVAIRMQVTLQPDEKLSVDVITGATETRDAAINLIDKYRDRNLADRVFDMAWTHAQVILRQLNASEADAQLYGRLASSILYANAAHRASPHLLSKNHRGQSGLWGHGISGDLPIVLLRLSSSDKIELLQQLVQAHAYWRLKGLSVDLVIWNEEQDGYRQSLQDLIIGLISSGTEAETLDHPGGIFIRRVEQISEEDRILLQTVARVVISDTEGSLSEQLERRPRGKLKIPEIPHLSRRRDRKVHHEKQYRELVFFNGLGGFTPDGHEYVIQLGPGEATPAPWVNVIANPMFGTVVSESGESYSWAENAHEFRITPWDNDPVSNMGGEAFYLRDEETGQFWSPVPRLTERHAPYLCRHGFGYTVFEATEFGIFSELWIYVARDASVKFATLKIRNVSGRTRKLSATAYCEWVLGELRAKGLMHIVTEIDPETQALLARNPYSFEFADRIAFLDVSDPSRTFTGDRTEFLGRNRSTARPAAMERIRLSGNVGAGLDPCGAVQTTFELADGREREIVFTLGVGRSIQEVRELVHRFRGPIAARQALEEVWAYWNRTLGAVHVETPDPAVNILANGWLLYQTLSCRYWARSGFYQSGGAFGFRDQLQDVAALLHAQPHLIREHVLRCARHQFVEGDVQHWWHPPQGRGVRTHFSDDLLWLPLIVCRYVLATGDRGVLDEVVPFLEGRELQPHEEAYYDLPSTSSESATLYEHCVRSIRRSFSFGVHGLPLMGCGDWNDGMNLVGQHGQGESVWLAFFFYENLNLFAALARQRGETDFADRCEFEAAQLRKNIEEHAWDGEWYLRAYFDNGDVLGAASNRECQIDSIAQSWSVLSGAGDPARTRSAMNAVDQRLVRRDAALIQLFDPPFDKSPLEPGYIKGYVPGVRENGGQYTHAAIWTVMAFAELGDHHRAWELFQLINPIHHGSTPSQIAKYKVEPYVVAADVYAVSPHTGRGGWTWYTGSASWMYRLIVESLLGLRLEVDKLMLTPCLPADWKSFKLHYRYRETFFHITVLQPAPARTVKSVTVDGVRLEDKSIPLYDDRQDHHIEVELGEH